MLPSGVPNPPTPAAVPSHNGGSRSRELMATVRGAIEANLRPGSTRHILAHTKKTTAPGFGQPAQYMDTQGGPRGMDIDPVKAVEELQYMKATYQHWIQCAASRGQGPEHETVKNWFRLARGVDAQIELWQTAMGQQKGGP